MLVRQILDNPMLNGETIRLDGAIRLAPQWRRQPATASAEPSTLMQTEDSQRAVGCAMLRGWLRSSVR